MYKSILFTLCLSLISLCCISQSNPGTWTFTAKKISDKQYEIRYSIRIAAPWHIYSQSTPDGGPLKTTITVGANPLVISKSKISEVGKLTTKHEDVFDVDVKYYENIVDFVQTVKLRSSAKTILKGNIGFMLCNDKQCLPPATVPFSIDLQ